MLRPRHELRETQAYERIAYETKTYSEAELHEAAEWRAHNRLAHPEDYIDAIDFKIGQDDSNPVRHRDIDDRSYCTYGAHHIGPCSPLPLSPTQLDAANRSTMSARNMGKRVNQTWAVKDLMKREILLRAASQLHAYEHIVYKSERPFSASDATYDMRDYRPLGKSIRDIIATNTLDLRNPLTREQFLSAIKANGVGILPPEYSVRPSMYDPFEALTNPCSEIVDRGPWIPSPEDLAEYREPYRPLRSFPTEAVFDEMVRDEESEEQTGLLPLLPTLSHSDAFLPHPSKTPFPIDPSTTNRAHMRGGWL